MTTCAPFTVALLLFLSACGPKENWVLLWFSDPGPDGIYSVNEEGFTSFDECDLKAKALTTASMTFCLRGYPYRRAGK